MIGTDLVLVALHREPVAAVIQVRASPRWRRTAIVVALTALAVLVSPSLGWGAGDPSLDRLMVGNPVPGWKHAGTKYLQSVVSLEQRSVSSITSGPVKVAAEGWKHGHDIALIVLLSFTHRVPQPGRQARAAVLGACAGATTNPPTSFGSFAAVRGASEGVCSGKNATGRTITATAVAWVKGNVFAILLVTGLPQTRVEAIAVKQDGALSKRTA